MHRLQFGSKSLGNRKPPIGRYPFLSEVCDWVYLTNSDRAGQVKQLSNDFDRFSRLLMSSTSVSDLLSGGVRCLGETPQAGLSSLQEISDIGLENAFGTSRGLRRDDRIDRFLEGPDSGEAVAFDEIVI